MSRTVLVTGAALSKRLLPGSDRVVGLENLNDHYDPSLKQARLRQIKALASKGVWRFELMAMEDGDALMALFSEAKPPEVVDSAAQARFRYSLENPAAYIRAI